MAKPVGDDAPAPAPAAAPASLSRGESTAVRAQLADIAAVLPAGEKFLDSSFPPNDDSLGDLNEGRPPERQGRAERLCWVRGADVGVRSVNPHGPCCHLHDDCWLDSSTDA